MSDNGIGSAGNIAGKVVVVTGASSGLGEATAQRLSALGAVVVLGARRADRIDARWPTSWPTGWRAQAAGRLPCRPT